MPGPLLMLEPVPRAAKRANFLRHRRSIPVGTASRARRKTRNPMVIQTRKYREDSHSVNVESPTVGIRVHHNLGGRMVGQVVHLPPEHRRPTFF